MSDALSATRVPLFSGRRVLVVGDVMLDRYVWGDVSRISPEAPVQVVRVDRKSYTLGGAGNVAANLAALGLDVQCLGVRGKDEDGRLLAEKFDEIGAKAHLVYEPMRPTTAKTRVMGRGQQLIRLDEEDAGPLSAEVQDALLRQVERSLPECGAVIVSDYAKGVFAGNLAQRIINVGAEVGVPVLVDPKGADWTRYQGAFCITPNTGEFQRVAQFDPRDDSDLGERASTAIHAFSLSWLLVTRGERGMSLFGRGGEALHVPTQAREVFDVSGAGDTVIATLAAGVAAGLSMEDSARLANAAAGVVVGKVGTQPVTRAELEEALALDEGGCAYKIRTREAAMEAVQGWKRQGENVVFTNGCFDLLHVGHITLLHKAAELGDRLVVGLNSDASVRRLKGETRPILPEAERASLLAALQDVDMVVIFDEDTPLELLNALKPDILVKGGDYVRETVVGHQEVESWGGRVELISLVDGKSTSSIIDRLRG
ncbi:bifunctional D-glycero-beta-D-manno-heptose-7-phosphate kinase/D-glycero-beta-D-manno-heptose 1-phosphate adenylyltransferase HldE [Desulfohalovibrio reitneri]|uniref:bifunctional D-glycero-beta-D-manno-heptose-7-phosphate kinase/D-glycero-beta-D-manno-heptose 1-phosphate adenylyltransferase HldE n=1 Tax=Desulfohalovibrio reitneri TaxID=1307759 RepID=UPI000691006B|nr:bifunctional D-glycero-beta-D-manno-heptose-7-phosphate kinase/D-glycero-beta-D-manno-heptose 1-phosphate adenylyltransferase HldE [Desulfohalovibrio reitneri]